MALLLFIGNVNIGLIPVSTGQATTHAIVPMTISKAGLDSKQVSCKCMATSLDLWCLEGSPKCWGLETNAFGGLNP